MRRLETVFISNVILYIKSIETIIKLIQVNKKCQEATKIIRYYKTRKLYESDDEEQYNYIIVKNVFNLFPNIETINCRYQDIKNNMEVFDKINLIELDSFFNENIELPQEIKDKVIKLNFKSESLNNIYLNEFPIAKRVKVEYVYEGFLEEFLGDKSIKLSQLIIHSAEDNEELDCLKEYKNIENKIIKIEYGMSKERYLELKEFSNVFTQHPVDGVDIKETLCLYEDFHLLNPLDINKLYEKTLFTKCYIENGFDLRNCELLEQITISCPKEKIETIQIKGLNHLKRIENVGKIDYIPSSVTYLSFNYLFNYKELLKKDKDCFTNIKEVKMRNENIKDSSLLLNFSNCTKIELENHSDVNIKYKFPMNVKYLNVGYCDNNTEIREIAKLTGLRQLSIDLNLIKHNTHFQQMYDQLKGLETLRTNYVEGINLPSTLTYLELALWNKTDLSQCTSLKDMKLFCRMDRNNEIKLPNKLNKLYIQGNIIVINSVDVKIDKIVFDASPSQFYEWNSKEVFIEKGFEENK